MINKAEKRNQIALKILLYFILVVFVILFAFPFYYVFVLASQEGTNMYVNPPHIFFGKFYLRFINL